MDNNLGILKNLNTSKQKEEVIDLNQYTAVIDKCTDNSNTFSFDNFNVNDFILALFGDQSWSRFQNINQNDSYQVKRKALAGCLTERVFTALNLPSFNGLESLLQYYTQNNKEDYLLLNNVKFKYCGIEFKFLPSIKLILDYLKTEGQIDSYQEYHQIKLIVYRDNKEYELYLNIFEPVEAL